MARGVDMWAAEIVLKERKKDSRIKLICASPFEGFEKTWSLTEKQQYKNIIKKADYVKFVCKYYTNNCFQIRNCYMVDNSSRVISAYNEERGGTQNTIKYAKKQKVEVLNILDETQA